MGADGPGDELESSLDAFRRAWRAELTSGKRNTTGSSRGQTQPVVESAHSDVRYPPSPSLTPDVPFVPSRPDAESAALSPNASAVECYARAIEAERSARLDEATALYRRAFRLDPQVEKRFQEYALVRSEVHPTAATDDLAFTFSRTVQLSDDWKDPKSPDVDSHPSSTSALRKRVLQHIEQHPFVRDSASDHPHRHAVPVADQQKYHAADEWRPSRLSLLPPELVVQILLHLVLPGNEQHYPHTEELEVHFARVCRQARLDSLEPPLWRSICERVYRHPQIPHGETAARLVRKHGEDWRRMYLSQPRLRTDGCFIGVQRYVRRGHQESAWVSPSHSVVYYRFLRLYADGRCVSLQTTTEPSEIVRQLHPHFRYPGLLVGQWALSLDGLLRCKLEDPALPREKRKYSFELEARLKSTSRGRMNKLEILRLSTCRRETLEVEELPLGADHGRPFYFSRVNAWEME